VKIVLMLFLLLFLVGCISMEEDKDFNSDLAEFERDKK